MPARVRMWSTSGVTAWSTRYIMGQVVVGIDISTSLLSVCTLFMESENGTPGQSSVNVISEGPYATV